MNKYLIFAAAFLVGAAMTLVAATEQEHVAWMKSVQKATGNLKKAIEAKDAGAAATEAKTLAGSFKTIGAFYADRHTEDAVKMSKDAEMAVADVETAIAANDFEKAGASMKTMMGTCSGCHKVHRTKKEDGSYAFK